MKLDDSVQSKRARVAAGVRNVATHADWNQFSVKDVHACIDLTRELIEKIDRG